MVNKAESTASNVYNPLSIDHASAAAEAAYGAISKSSPTSTSSDDSYVLENVLMLLAISVGAYAGCLIRIGFSMFYIWNIESNYVTACLFCFKYDIS